MGQERRSSESMVAGRYRIESRLGRGGMADVLRRPRHAPGPPGRDQAAAGGPGLRDRPGPVRVRGAHPGRDVRPGPGHRPGRRHQRRPPVPGHGAAAGWDRRRPGRTAGPSRWTGWPRSARRWRRRWCRCTRPASSTATSSPATSCSTAGTGPAGRLRHRPAGRGHRPGHRDRYDGRDGHLPGAGAGVRWRGRHGRRRLRARAGPPRADHRGARLRRDADRGGPGPPDPRPRRTRPPARSARQAARRDDVARTGGPARRGRARRGARVQRAAAWQRRGPPRRASTPRPLVIAASATGWWTPSDW